MRARPLEVAVLAVALSALAAVLYGPNAIDGGFLSDAWAFRALYEFSPNGGLLGGIERLLDEPSLQPRPLYAAYLGFENAVFGSKASLWIAWQSVLGVLMSVSLYLLLRDLSFSRRDGAAIAALVLIFPAASSLRLWSVPIAPLSIALATLGFVLALRAFDARPGSRKSWVLHGCSLAMFLASTLLYEVTLPVLLASVLLYRLRVPWSRAVRRWLVDCGVLLSAALLTKFSSAASSEFQRQSLDGMWHHVTLMWDQSLTLLATVVFPFSDRWYVLVPIVLVPAAALAVRHRRPDTDPSRAPLGRWLAVLAAGVAVVALGYALFVPTVDYYAPMAQGIANRTNALSSIGWVLVAYSLIMLVATMASRPLARASATTAAFAVLGSVLLAGSWIEPLSDDADAFTRASSEGETALNAIEAAVPDPPPESTLWTFGQPVEIAPGVPVFGNTWDMTTSVQLMYDDPTLQSYVGYPETTFECTAYSVIPGGNANYPRTDSFGISEFASGYGRTFFVETTTGRAVRIDTPSQCRRASESFPRSPSYPPE